MPFGLIAGAVGGLVAKGAKSLAKKAITAVAKKPAVGAVAATVLPAALPSILPSTINIPGQIDLPGNIGSINLPGLGRPGAGFQLGGAKRGRIAPGPNGACPKGYHLNKSATADGAAPRSFCCRNRRMNYANGRAAGRAGRRLRGTVKQMRKFFSLVSAKAPKGKFIPKKRGK